jgi:hypothetical protein
MAADTFKKPLSKPVAQTAKDGIDAEMGSGSLCEEFSGPATMGTGTSIQDSDSKK